MYGVCPKLMDYDKLLIFQYLEGSKVRVEHRLDYVECYPGDLNDIMSMP